MILAGFRDVDITKAAHIRYKYILTYADGYKVIEWGNDKEMIPVKAVLMKFSW